jgi:curved DNA-binding protein CbpA
VPPRPSIPADDLYARLEIPLDAGPEVIELAWRSLLRQHHPDVAGDAGLERAKRINVAHDWLSDPDLRARYDAERGIRRSIRATGGRSPRTAETAPIRPGARPRRRPLDPAETLARFLDRVATLTPDEVDRLAFADTTPIAFRAAIVRFLPEDQLAALSSMETAVDGRLDPLAASRPGVRDAIDAYATELVLSSFLDELLSEPFRDRARERLTRGWDAAVGQPRYGPNGVVVRGLIARLADLDATGTVALAGTARRARLDEHPEPPWPAGTSPDDDEALRVSSLLAQQDAAAALRDGATDPATTARARASAAHLAHLLVLRHAYPPATFAARTKLWRPRFLPDERPGPRVRRPR